MLLSPNLPDGNLSRKGDSNAKAFKWWSTQNAAGGGGVKPIRA